MAGPLFDDLKELRGTTLACLNGNRCYCHGHVLRNLLCTVHPVVGGLYLRTFEGIKCPFSNIYPCSIEFQGTKFNCLTQAYSYHRAVLEGRSVTASNILACNNPFQVLRFSACSPKNTTFSEIIYLLETLITLKYQQVREFRLECKATLRRQCLIIGEDSRSKFWGVRRTDAGAYTGKNILGWLIMKVYLEQEDKGLGRLESYVSSLADAHLLDGLKIVLKIRD